MRSIASATVLVTWLCACGRIGFAPGADAGAADPDARDDAAACAGPFAAPVLVASIATGSDEWGGALSPDGLELYFGTDRSGDYDIYRATRASRADAFGAPALVSELESGSNEDNPFVTSDGLELWFDRAGGIMRSTRDDLASSWQPPQPVPALDSGANDVSPMLRDDALVVYFASDRTPGEGNLDLYMATRSTREAPFGTPVALAALNTAAFDCCPHLTSGGATLLFTTSALGGGAKIAAVELDGSGLPIGSVTPAELDDVGEEVDVFETPDGTLRGYSYRPVQGAGDFDVYLVERTCP